MSYPNRGDGGLRGGSNDGVHLGGQMVNASSSPRPPLTPQANPAFDLDTDIADLRELIMCADFAADVAANDDEGQRSMVARFDVTEVATRDRHHYDQFVALVAMLSLTQPSFGAAVVAEKTKQETAALVGMFLDLLD